MAVSRTATAIQPRQARVDQEGGRSRWWLELAGSCSERLGRLPTTCMAMGRGECASFSDVRRRGAHDCLPTAVDVRRRRERVSFLSRRGCSPCPSPHRTMESHLVHATCLLLRRFRHPERLLAQSDWSTQDAFPPRVLDRTLSGSIPLPASHRYQCERSRSIHRSLRGWRWADGPTVSRSRRRITWKGWRLLRSQRWWMERGTTPKEAKGT